MPVFQVDFANSLVGGGVLKSGSVQEEIQFLMSPELIVARLFTERLGDNECLRITGISGRNAPVLAQDTVTTFPGRDLSTIKQNGTCGKVLLRRLLEMKIVDGSPDAKHVSMCISRDDWKRRYRQIVTLDAVDYKRSPREQYTKGSITRELNKAYVGFSGNPKTAVATGNWGCGAFKGDAKLKALIQLMAAAVCERDLAFFTFRNQEQVSDVKRMHQLLNSKRVSVGESF
ncbi:hypothetical protein DNTS_026919 [Danionella cerebrum]|uniref:PARG catalytic Macro domain-containing protein n=1 Tax=Danionella cerebrum TaxID=2873325 RepID=A0A553QKG2_9TELE|nr:hypothetical protein DNTS_026919 [Danionella translucida]